MKKDIHPNNYRPVVFEDGTTKAQFIISSTVATDEKTEVKGVEYPLFRVEISSDSHPFYTGESNTIDTAGRLEKFRARVAKSKK